MNRPDFQQARVGHRRTVRSFAGGFLEFGVDLDKAARMVAFAMLIHPKRHIRAFVARSSSSSAAR